MRLEAAGFHVAGPAARVSDALAILNAEKVDAALLDMNIIGSTSIPIAERLAADGTPFIFVSGNDSTRLPEEFSGRPITTKPIDYQRLIGQVRVICGLDQGTPST